MWSFHPYRRLPTFHHQRPNSAHVIEDRHNTGASFMAKLAQPAGGFTASTTAPEMIGQIQILDVKDLEAARKRLLDNKEDLLKEAATYDPVLVSHGGGPRDIIVRIIEQSPIGPFLVLHLIYDVRDAMGANAINTALERLALGSNPFRAAGFTCVYCPTWPIAPGTRQSHYSADRWPYDIFCEEERDGINAAWHLPQPIPIVQPPQQGHQDRVDAEVLATGNVWRAIEAGALLTLPAAAATPA